MVNNNIYKEIFSAFLEGFKIFASAFFLAFILVDFNIIWTLIVIAISLLIGYTYNKSKEGSENNGNS